MDTKSADLFAIGDHGRDSGADLVRSFLARFLPGKNSKSIAPQRRIEVDQLREHVEKVALRKITTQLFSRPVTDTALEFVEEPLRCPEGPRAVEGANIRFLNAAPSQA